jgi:RimJ/RimL family protein N-acetyltransferase
MTSIWAGRKVRLRGIEPEDWQAFMGFDQYTADVRSVENIHPPRSAAGYRQWATERSTQVMDDDTFQLAIESLAENALVGALSTTAVQRCAGRFKYGIGIGRDHQRRGFASDAIVVLLTYMFAERRFHKCEADIYAFNEGSIELHKKLGFQIEGRLREREYFAGRHHDLVVMGMTRPEFTERYPLPEV